MIQESIKQSLESIQATRERLEQQLRPQLDWASGELKKVLVELGADSAEPASLQETLQQIRERNPSLRVFTRRLDVATYDLRKKLWWDANMMTAFATSKAEAAYDTDIRPKLQAVRSETEARARTAIEQIRQLSRQLTRQDDASDTE